MKIDKDKIKHLAWLARIELRDEELDTYEEQIDKIIKYLDILDEADAKEEPTYLITTLEGLRDDESRMEKDVFSVVINKKDRFVKAPKM